jgi:hypothetical protein
MVLKSQSTTVSLFIRMFFLSKSASMIWFETSKMAGLGDVNCLHGRYSQSCTLSLERWEQCQHARAWTVQSSSSGTACHSTVFCLFLNFIKRTHRMTELFISSPDPEQTMTELRRQETRNRVFHKDSRLEFQFVVKSTESVVDLLYLTSCALEPSYIMNHVRN